MSRGRRSGQRRRGKRRRKKEKKEKEKGEEKKENEDNEEEQVTHDKKKIYAQHLRKKNAVNMTHIASHCPKNAIG